MIDISTLKESIKVLEECSLEKIEISDGNDTISLEKPHSVATAPAAVTVNAAPSPESEPYVHVGQKVKKGDVVCIIEAMKCMNEIQAEEDGEITAVLATNGELVEYNQPLFAIK